MDYLPELIIFLQNYKNLAIKYSINVQNNNQKTLILMKKEIKPIQTSILNFLKANSSMAKQQQKHHNNSQINSDLSKSSNSSESKNIVQNNEQKIVMLNVQFYRNQRPSQPNGDYIDVIHKKWRYDFDKLQRHHGFIQWLFPNQYSSRFNSKSAALSPEQAILFRTDYKIAQKYVLSYQIILQFYGMKMISKQSGQITQQRRFDFKQRYNATLRTSFHNHLRVTRILCSLTMVGFGRYAKQLSLFLQQQIHGQNGNLKSLEKYNVDKDWKQYLDYKQQQDQLNIYLKENYPEPEKSKISKKRELALQEKSQNCQTKNKSVNKQISKQTIESLNKQSFKKQQRNKEQKNIFKVKANNQQDK